MNLSTAPPRGSFLGNNVCSCTQDIHCSQNELCDTPTNTCVAQGSCVGETTSHGLCGPHTTAPVPREDRCAVGTVISRTSISNGEHWYCEGTDSTSDRCVACDLDYSPSDDRTACVTENETPVTGPVGIVSFTTSRITVSESAGSFDVCARKRGGSSVNLTLETHDGTATAGSDYTAGPHTVTLSRDGVSCTTVSLVTDAVAEGDEFFSLSLASSDRYTTESPDTLLVIIEDTPVPGTSCTGTVSWSDGDLTGSDCSATVALGDGGLHLKDIDGTHGGELLVSCASGTLTGHHPVCFRQCVGTTSWGHDDTSCGPCTASYRLPENSEDTLSDTDGDITGGVSVSCDSRGIITKHYPASCSYAGTASWSHRNIHGTTCSAPFSVPLGQDGTGTGVARDSLDHSSGDHYKGTLTVTYSAETDQITEEDPVCEYVAPAPPPLNLCDLGLLACHDDSDCSGNDYCSFGCCRECRKDSDCTSSVKPYCVSSIWCGECRSNSHCSGSTPYCDATGNCVECRNDSHCPGDQPCVFLYSDHPTRVADGLNFVELQIRECGCIRDSECPLHYRCDYVGGGECYYNPLH